MLLALSSAQIWVLAVAGVLACFAVGSFACVVIERMPLRLDEPNEWGDDFDTRPWAEVVGGDSRCSSCGAPIRWFNKVPVFSWVVLRGRCRDCSERIPGFHPLVEAAVPIVVVALGVALDWGWRSVPALWLVPVGIVVAVIDLRTFIVPTRVVWPAFAVSVALSVAAAAIEGQWSWLWGGVLGVLMLAGPLMLLWFILPNGMGFGDVRLATLLGWTLGFVAYSGRWQSVLFLVALLLTAAAIIGLLMGLGALMSIGRKAKVAFGPALVLATFTIVAFADVLLEGFAIGQ